MRIDVKLLSPAAFLPAKSHKEDVGYDLTSIELLVIAPHKSREIRTGIALASCPRLDKKQGALSVYTKIEGRSGLACQGIFPIGGIVDPGYRGEIKVILYNGSDKDFIVAVGDKIAQLVCYAVVNGMNEDLEMFTEVDTLEYTSRNDKGFGSTGA